jgi:hypothetical protein
MNTSLETSTAAEVVPAAEKTDAEVSFSHRQNTVISDHPSRVIKGSRPAMLALR